MQKLRTTVSYITTQPQHVEHDYKQVIDSAQLTRSVEQTYPIHMLIDQRRPMPFPAAQTPPWQLDCTIDWLKQHNAKQIGAFIPPKPRLGFWDDGDSIGYAALLRQHKIAAQSGTSTLVEIPPHFTHLRAAFGKSLRVPSELLGAQLIVLPVLSTDRVLGFAGALACMARTLVPALTHMAHPHELLVDLLSLLRDLGGTWLAVMDATMVGDGPAPYNIAPSVRNLVLASADPLALDAYAAHLAGLEPLRDLPYLRLAHERGLGNADLSQTELISAGGPQPQPWALQWPQRYRAESPQLLHVPAALESAYTQFVRWPLRERNAFESWLVHTGWGKLFGRYQRQLFARHK